MNILHILTEFISKAFHDKPCRFLRLSMLVKCDSDVTVFILNCSLTSTFCLRRESGSLKPVVLLILALCDWCAVALRTFARVSLERNLWLIPSCICEQPQLLLQTVIFVFNVAILTLNTDLSEEGHFIKRRSYLHLFLFNVASIILAKAITHVIAQAFGDVGGALEASHVSGITFLVSVYRTMFLSLDSLYYAYMNRGDNKRTRYISINKLRLGGEAVIINI